MRFILVEDDKYSIDRVKSIITKTLFVYNIDYNILVFKKYSESLKEEINDLSTLKTYILSIDLKQNVSGIDIAEYIREKDIQSNIIFLTKHGNMFEMAHRKVCNVFEFIEKYQKMDKRLSKDIRKIINYNLDDKTLNYSYCHNKYRIYYKAIKYIKRNTKTRKLLIYTNNNIFESNLTIKEILSKLDNRFIRVSKSSIINSDYVYEFNWNKGIANLIDNNMEISISKKYKPDYTCLKV